VLDSRKRRTASGPSDQANTFERFKDRLAFGEASERIGRILRLDEVDRVREGYRRGYQASSGD